MIAAPLDANTMKREEGKMATWEVEMELSLYAYYKVEAETESGAKDKAYELAGEELSGSNSIGNFNDYGNGAKAINVTKEEA